MNDGTIQVWVYENISFEMAQDVETQTFPWTEEGVTAIKAWLDEKLTQRGSQPYRIWAGNHVRDAAPAAREKSGASQPTEE